VSWAAGRDALLAALERRFDLAFEPVDRTVLAA